MTEVLGRRALLGLVAAGLALPGEALAKREPTIRDVTQSAIGTTFALWLKSAPFPSPGYAYADQTVVAFVPKHYRAPKGGRLDCLVHFHGHGSLATEAVKQQALREQVYESKQNIILLAPQGAVRASESPPGKLGVEGGLRRMIAEAAQVLASPRAQKSLGKAATPRRPRLGRVAISAHSGGYYPASICLSKGGIAVSEVYLFDALYGEVAAYRDWLVAKKSHKLVSYVVSGQVRGYNRQLEAALEARGVACLHEPVTGPKLSRAELVRGRAIFLDVVGTHGGATYGQNQLRDCLFASGFDRHVASGWFKDKEAPRKVDPREGS